MVVLTKEQVIWRGFRVLTFAVGKLYPNYLLEKLILIVPGFLVIHQA
jgi:hypothetical protein